MGTTIIDNTKTKREKKQQAEKYLKGIEEDEMRAKTIGKGAPSKAISFPPPTEEELEFMKRTKGFF